MRSVSAETSSERGLVLQPRWVWVQHLGCVRALCDGHMLALHRCPTSVLQTTKCLLGQAQETGILRFAGVAHGKGS